MDKDKYNGHKNYATWCVHSWLTSDETISRKWADRVNQSRGEHIVKRAPKLYKIADEMKEDIQNQAYDLFNGGSMLQDLLLATIDDVDFQEVVKSFIDE